MEPAKQPSRNSSALSSLCSTQQSMDIESIKKPVREAWTMTVFSDSDYARDTGTRISVTGFCVFYGCSHQLEEPSAEECNPVVKQSRICGSVQGCNLSFKSCFPLGLKSIHVDNVRAIAMAENVSTSPRTKPVCYHFVREFIEDHFIKIVFV